ncbi:MAG: enoyl-CoA hydratase/isomerase family protein [Actinobacteria bacterium]|nr:enoyl-CoA hydratase/isomerase family protein [Actinomycetota bacterium]
MAEYVGTEIDGAVALVTIDRPPVNALSAALIGELEHAFTTLGDDSAVRAIVLRGAGERAFVAGADISEFPSIDEGTVSEGGSARGIQKLAGQMEALPKPIVAAIHGYCLGGGLETALACDVRIAAEDAQLGFPEIKLGLLPGGGGTQRSVRAIGPARAKLLYLTGDPISGQQAYEWGLVERVVPRAELVEAAKGLAATLAERSPHAIGELKALALASRDLPVEEGQRLEAEAFARCLASEDGREGVSAFLEKRAPRFTGR